MKRLPGYLWPVGMPQTRRNRRYRKPPPHFNPAPKFGLSLAFVQVIESYIRDPDSTLFYFRADLMNRSTGEITPLVPGHFIKSLPLRQFHNLADDE